ncbi:SDR family oxidoreductase [Streptomyces sp. CRPSP2-6A1]|uniref:SDR family NAD(P)-dependent oxidoreductase n=1 Tax=Streptomyces sp. CRPSP2-6A1 TaxID=2799588 RepID=UPI0018F07282|nr:SDR family oxidoreductase [Streptomyces sp. CRPSP2-6A1]MBJ7005456.1 SDR family oxidoreductase [Streptomyces sp. CRPSP2-6A1]
MSTVAGKVAVVTGAGSGIGRSLAFELARRGARLALSDIDGTGLAETAAQVTSFGAEVHIARLDISDRTAVESYATTVAEHFGAVHRVYNNAGIGGGGGTVLETEWSVYERTIAISLFGVVHGTKAFLPHLIASGDGHVVNISSLNGIMAQPTLSAYCAAKFGVRGFTETLRTEMLAGRHPVRVSVVHPGGVRTNTTVRSATQSVPGRRCRLKTLSRSPSVLYTAFVARGARARPPTSAGRPATRRSTPWRGAALTNSIRDHSTVSVKGARVIPARVNVSGPRTSSPPARSSARCRCPRAAPTRWDATVMKLSALPRAAPRKRTSPRLAAPGSEAKKFFASTRILRPVLGTITVLK